MTCHRALVVALVVVLCACGSDSGDEQEQAIIGGQPATDFPEGVLVRAEGHVAGRYAGGTVISPHVVLTVDHVGSDPYTSWAVSTMPLGQGQTAKVVRAEVVDLGMKGGYCNTHCWFLGLYGNNDKFYKYYHGVALLYLDRPIVLERYPYLVTEPIADGTPVRRYGTNVDGNFDGRLYVSAPDAVYNGKPYNLPSDYIAAHKTLLGDGGGAVVLDRGGRGHDIVAVNWGSGDGNQFRLDFWNDVRTYDYMVRVDLLAPKIFEKLAAYEAEVKAAGDAAWE